MKNKRIFWAFTISILALILLIFISINLGSLKVSYVELFKGLFIEYNKTVASIYDIRFPRIIICILAGASLSVSGLLFQSVLKNPIADPSFLGISSGAECFSTIIMYFFPQLYFFKPIFAFFGGIIAFCLIYSLANKNGLYAIRIILIGLAINFVFTGLIEVFSRLSTLGNVTVSTSSISFKNWTDVKLIVTYSLITLFIVLFLHKYCDLLSLTEKTARGLGINTTLLKISISIFAIILTSISTAVLGLIAFIGLIVPHISRIVVGNGHKVLIPFCMIFGAFMLLLADTIGRNIIPKVEIDPGIIMNIFGGLFFIILLRKSGKVYGS